MARAIVRKSGLRPGGEGEGGAPERPTTLIDDYIDPAWDAISFQWGVDLTNYTRVRLSTQIPRGVYVMYSLDTTTTLDPGDFAVLSGVDDAGLSAEVWSSSLWHNATDLRWISIPAATRTRLRLALSSASDSVKFFPQDFPFTVMLQAFVGPVPGTLDGDYPPPPELLPPVEGETDWPDQPLPEPGYPPIPEEDMPYP